MILNCCHNIFWAHPKSERIFDELKRSSICKACFNSIDLWLDTIQFSIAVSANASFPFQKIKFQFQHNTNEIIISKTQDTSIATQLKTKYNKSGQTYIEILTTISEEEFWFLNNWLQRLSRVAVNENFSWDTLTENTRWLKGGNSDSMNTWWQKAYNVSKKNIHWDKVLH